MMIASELARSVSGALPSTGSPGSRCRRPGVPPGERCDHRDDAVRDQRGGADVPRPTSVRCMISARPCRAPKLDRDGDHGDQRGHSERGHQESFVSTVT
ncbi:hypothetical protein V2I01_00105 [Micromonospora sp. BRA006-A]|nr:hypothetical protein [Micromonospora sp. BRA006-A]